MTWITGADLDAWQETVNRGEELCLDQCRHLLAEVRRLRRELDAAREKGDFLAERLDYYEDQLESLTL